MADLIVFPEAIRLIQTGALDLVSDTLKGVLVGTASTVPTEPDATTLAGFTTLDEFDGANYARTTITGRASSKVAALQKVFITADDLAFGVLGVGTRAATGLLIVKHVDGASGDIPVAFLRFAAATNGDGAGAYTVTFPSGRILSESYPA